MTDHAPHDPTARRVDPPGLAPPPSPGPTVAQDFGDTVLNELLQRDPDSMPEALRLLTMTKGGLDGVSRRVTDLEERLAHVLGDSYPEATTPGREAFPVQTALGRRVDDLYREVSSIEDRLGRILGRLGV